MNKVYLDNAATTMVSKEVLESMMPYYMDYYGNPGSLHDMGSEAKRAVDNAREIVGEFMGCDPDHVIFTSGGSEANSIVISGFTGSNPKMYTRVEHPSVIKAMESKHGAMSAWPLPVHEDGTVFTVGLEDAMRKHKVDFLAAMWVNNEIGSINDISYLADVCKNNNVWLHTDCVQAAGGIKLKAQNTGVSSMSISSHKIHGPKGVGALYVRDFSKMNGFIFGGQEHGIRGGTENVPGIVGFAKACEICMRDFDSNVEKIRSNKMRFVNAIKYYAKKNSIEDRLRFNSPENGESKIINFRIKGVDAQTLLMTLNGYGIYASAASACKSREMTPSHVLKAIGLSDEEAYSSVRFSLSRYTTPEEIEYAAKSVIDNSTKLLAFLANGG